MTAPAILTRYAPMRAVLTLLPRVARGGEPVMITGELGVGKSVVARTLHQLSLRRGPVVVVDCAGGTEGELRDGLFRAGRETPAADGRSRPRGAVLTAAGGTLVLHEIGGLPLTMQHDLRRLVERWRSDPDDHAHFPRVVATTSRSAPADGVADRLLPELDTQLSAIRIDLPPLRERAVDIPLLAEHFARRHGAAGAAALTAPVLDSLERYDWPGNIRELRLVVDRIIQAGGPMPGAGGGSIIGMPLTLAEVERRHIADVLGRCGWHQAHAADMLGISPKTLYRKIREFGLQRPIRREDS